MPQIVPQSASFPLTLFPPNMPLLLSAPKIAGLLMPPRPSEPPPPEPEAEPVARVFTYRHARFAELTEGEYAAFIRATDILLEVGVNYMLGVMNEDALRAAEIVFHRGVGGAKSKYPLNPEAYSAERDADFIGLAVRLPRAFSDEARDRARARMEAQLTAYRAKQESQGVNYDAI